MNINQISNYLSMSALFVMLAGVAVYYSYVSEEKTKWTKFSGYIIDDEELSGFFSCTGERGMSFTDVGNTGVSELYWRKKTFIRESIYVEFMGRVAGNGGPGWGMAGEPWEKNVEINSIIKIEREFPENCKARRNVETKFIFDE